MVLVPLLLLVVFGYAASFDVKSVPTKVVGPLAEQAAGRLPSLFDVSSVRPGEDRADGVADLRSGDYAVVVVTGVSAPSIEMLVDGTELFDAQAITRAAARA